MVKKNIKKVCRLSFKFALNFVLLKTYTTCQQRMRITKKMLLISLLLCEGGVWSGFVSAEREVCKGARIPRIRIRHPCGSRTWIHKSLYYVRSGAGVEPCREGNKYTRWKTSSSSLGRFLPAGLLRARAPSWSRESCGAGPGCTIASPGGIIKVW